MKTICYATIFIFMLVACDKDKLPANRDLPVLQDRFHGKYDAISAESSEAVDVNLDGVASTNLLSEIPDLKNSDLEIRIYSINQSLLVQFWPEQYFAYGPLPVAYSPNMVVHYLNQSVVRLFTFAPDLKQILLQPDTSPRPDSIRFQIPSSVTIGDNDHIQVISPRSLFTRNGWKKVEVTVIYQRYTKQT
jgi:hypothetical protein